MAAKARREIPHRAVTLEQLFGKRRRISLPSATFARAARRLGHEGLGRFQKRSAFLFELFLPRHYHLVVRRLLDPSLDKVLTDILLVFDPRSAVPGGGRDHVPFLDRVRVGVSLFGRVRGLRTEQFPTGLIPISVCELVRGAFRDERDFAGALFHFIGRRGAEAVAMN